MLGREIRKFIEENGLKKKTIAQNAGLSQQQLSDICNERRKVEAMEYFNICKALDIDLEYFPNLLSIKKAV